MDYVKNSFKGFSFNTEFGQVFTNKPTLLVEEDLQDIELLILLLWLMIRELELELKLIFL